MNIKLNRAIDCIVVFANSKEDRETISQARDNTKESLTNAMSVIDSVDSMSRNPSFHSARHVIAIAHKQAS
jgi:hypothetical protein